MCDNNTNTGNNTDNPFDTINTETTGNMRPIQEGFCLTEDEDEDED